MNWNQLLQPNRPRVTIRQNSYDLRTEFEKDYHRIIGSVAFRRLQDKTQVFPLDKSDFIRTRLTHSLEVSSLAKSLGQNVGTRIIRAGADADFTEQSKEDMSHILECAGLAHDIGNPPFGHFGEIAIRTWFKDYLYETKFNDKLVKDYLTDEMIADFLNFDGNAQGLRLLTRLHHVVDDNGMNLTYGLLGTLIKYPRSSVEKDENSDNISHHKLGYFTADKDTFDKVELQCGTRCSRHPLTYLLEAADDIAYKTADIEDGFKKHFIRFDDLINEFEVLEADNEDEFEDIYRPSEVLNKFYERAVHNGLENPEEYAVINWAIKTQSYLLKEATDGFMRHYDEIMAGTYKYDVFYGTYADKLMTLLHSIAWSYIFDTPFIYKLEIRSWHVYESLLDMFAHAVLYYDTDKEKEKLSPVDKKVLTIIEKPYMRAYALARKGKDDGYKLYLRLMMIVDFVSGMTDTKALKFYQELNGFVEI